MGLDMYAYRVRKPSKTEAIALNGLEERYLDEWAESHNYRIFSIDDEEDARLLHDMLPYMVKATVIREHIDLDRIKSDNGIPNTAIICGQGWNNCEINYTFSWGHATKRVTMDEAKLQTYVYKSEDVCYITDMEQIWYGRKEYDIKQAIHDSGDDVIENCGYYKCNDAMLQVLCDMGGMTMPEPDEGEKEIIVYHEWY